MRRGAFRAFLAAVALPGFLCDVARATVLTLNVTETSSGGWFGDLSGTPRDYGDRIAAFPTASGTGTYHYGSVESFTPKIEVDDGDPVADGDLWDYSNGDLDRIVLPYNGVGILEAIFTADPVYEINHRDLDTRVWNMPTAPSVSSEW